MDELEEVSQAGFPNDPRQVTDILEAPMDVDVSPPDAAPKGK